MPIVAINPVNPCSDGRQSERAMEIRTGTVRHFEALGHSIIAEFPLANGRRADLIALDRKGAFTIIEIKSSIEDFRNDAKWPEYLACCDRFYFASGPHVPEEIFPADHGLIIADRYDAAELRPPREGRLAGATRKALTLRFARLAALRLERMTRFGIEHGFAADFSVSADDDGLE